MLPYRLGSVCAEIEVGDHDSGFGAAKMAWAATLLLASVPRCRVTTSEETVTLAKEQAQDIDTGSSPAENPSQVCQDEMFIAKGGVWQSWTTPALLTISHRLKRRAYQWVRSERVLFYFFFHHYVFLGLFSCLLCAALQLRLCSESIWLWREKLHIFSPQSQITHILTFLWNAHTGTWQV